MEPDLQALLAERAALALSLGVTVDDEVFFLEDLLLEVQLLREEQRRRSGLAAPDAPSAAPAAPDALSAAPAAPDALSAGPTAPGAGPAAPGAPGAEDAEAQALLHEARQAERAFVSLEKQSPDGVLALGSSGLLQQHFAEACRALVRLLLRAPERGAEQQLWKLHHRVADAHQRAVRGLAATVRRPLPEGAPPSAELAAACAALEAFLRDAGALYSALIAAVDPPLSSSLAAEAAATTAAAAAFAAPPPVAVRVLSRPSERGERNEGGEGGPPAHHPLVDPTAAAAMAARPSRTAAAALAAHCCVARGDLFRYGAQLPIVASATARRDAAAGARRHYAAAARLRPAEGRPHHQLALLSAAAPGSALETIYRYARALGCAPAWPKCPGSQQPMRPPTAPEARPLVRGYPLGP